MSSHAAHGPNKLEEEAAAIYKLIGLPPPKRAADRENDENEAPDLLQADEDENRDGTDAAGSHDENRTGPRRPYWDDGEWWDVSAAQDGTVMRRFIEDSSTHVESPVCQARLPRFDTHVRLRVESRAISDTLEMHPDHKRWVVKEKCFAVDPSVEVVVGHDSLVPGLEQGVMTLSEGSTVDFRLAPSAAFGAEGYPERGVKPEMWVQFRVTALEYRFEDVDPDEMDPDTIIEAAHVAKREGNDHFQKDEHAIALGKYKKALMFIGQALSQLSGSPVVVEVEKAGLPDTLRELAVACKLNAAYCYLEMEHWNEAEVLCRDVLRTDPKHEKATFRLGRALGGKRQWKKARKAFDTVLAMNSKNMAVRNQIELLHESQEKELADERAQYSRMLGIKTPHSSDAPVQPGWWMQFVESVLEAGFVPAHLQVFNAAVGLFIIGLVILLVMGRSSWHLNLLLALASIVFTLLQWFVTQLPQAAYQSNLRRQAKKQS
jgi:tetratricopeptide (TPR) repeat protein